MGQGPFISRDEVNVGTRSGLNGKAVVPRSYNRYNKAVKVAIRKIGNSLGVLLPKSTLESWGVAEGDSLELTPRGLRPPRVERGQDVLDELKRLLALAIVRRCTPQEIRAQSLGNLHRWKNQGSWVSAYDEWLRILEQGSDGELFAAMLGRDEEANRLRQSPPYVGLLSREEVTRLNEEAAG
jgi:antitoxin component of MazEF toxin-antitoxin module